MRRPFLSGGEFQWGGQIRQVSAAGLEIAGIPQSIERALVADGSEHRNGSTAVGHLERLPRFHPTKQFACTLAKLAHADFSHVLFVAHEQNPCKCRRPTQAHRS